MPRATETCHAVSIAQFGLAVRGQGSAANALRLCLSPYHSERSEESVEHEKACTAISRCKTRLLPGPVIPHCVRNDIPCAGTTTAQRWRCRGRRRIRGL